MPQRLNGELQAGERGAELVRGDEEELVPQADGLLRRRARAPLVQEEPIALLFGVHARGDVAEAPDPPDHAPSEALGLRITLEDPPVPKRERIEGARLGLGIEVADALQE